MTTELQPRPAAEAAAAQVPAPARLTVPRAEALRMIKAQLERGLDIKRMKIRYVADLERARAAKGEWTTTTMTMLKGLFDTAAVADECQNWVGKVLPEYADLALFIEHFYDEMDQRIRKLHAVWKGINDRPAAPDLTGVPAARDPAPPARGEPALAAAAAAPQPPPGRRPAGALIACDPDDRPRAAVQDFCAKLGFDLTIVPTEALGGAAEPFARFDAPAHLDFALVLTTPAAALDPFQLGYCVGRLGPDRLFVLTAPDGKPSADPHGLPQIPLDPADGWHLHLARQFKRAGLPVDLNRVF